MQRRAALAVDERSARRDLLFDLGLHLHELAVLVEELLSRRLAEAADPLHVDVGRVLAEQQHQVLGLQLEEGLAGVQLGARVLLQELFERAGAEPPHLHHPAHHDRKARAEVGEVLLQLLEQRVVAGVVGPGDLRGRHALPHLARDRDELGRGRALGRRHRRADGGLVELVVYFFGGHAADGAARASSICYSSRSTSSNPSSSKWRSSIWSPFSRLADSSKAGRL